MLSPDEALPASIDRAYADAERLVMEIDMDDLDPLSAQTTMMELGLLPEDQSLQDMLDSHGNAQLNEQARAIGIDPIMLSRFRPWLAAVTLTPGGELTSDVYPSSTDPGRLNALVIVDQVGGVALTPDTAAGAKAYRCVTDPLN